MAWPSPFLVCFQNSFQLLPYGASGVDSGVCRKRKEGELAAGSRGEDQTSDGELAYFSEAVCACRGS